jgi:DNA-binding helix-hairpin-helix protein with protein kinase domain
MQSAHIDEYLRATPVWSSRVRGIGPARVGTLAAHGISTAADIAAVYGATIIRSDGVSVNPRGIGQGRAAALYSWRLAVEAIARSSQPTALPPARRQAIAHRYARERQSLQNDQVAARGRASLELTSLRNKWAATHSDIAQELQRAKERLETLRTAPNPELAAARKQSETANWQRDFAQLELNRYRRIRYSRYLRRLVTG